MNLMRYIKKATALTAAAAITMTAAISASAADGADFFDKGAEKDANGVRPGYADIATLDNSAVLKANYDRLYNKCVELWNSTADVAVTRINDTDTHVLDIIKIKDLIPDFDIANVHSSADVYDLYAELGKLIQLVYNDNPLFYFMHQFNASIVQTSDGEYAFVIFVHDDYASGAERQNIQAKIKEFYGQAAAKIEGKETRAQQYAELYKYLIDNMTYAFEKNPDGSYKLDENGNMIPSLAAHAHNIVGPLKKEGVCESYARSYELLCNFAGLDVLYDFGMATDADNQGNLGGHAWNFIKLDDGKYYAVDCTWDDQITEMEGAANDPRFALNMNGDYALFYFGSGKGRFQRDHSSAGHDGQTRFGENVDIPGEGTIFAKAWNYFCYEVEQVAGVACTGYDYNMPGDVNYDLEFDMRDLIRLGRYTVAPAETYIAKAAANADGAGEINMVDAVYLQKSLLGYEECVPHVDTENYPSRT